jgi:CDP-4-dehydro-6-deoxyglucose reductase, E3
MPKVILSNGIEFECLPNQTILDAAKLNKISIEYSCNSGKCGVCIAPLLTGETKAVNIEQSLNEIDINTGKILTCCREPLTDISLDIEDLGEIGNIPALTLPCRIDALEPLNDDVIKATFRLPPSSNFKYIPGQYINLKYGNISRSYSIANAPRKDLKIELQIKKVERGLMSDYFFYKACQNDLLRMEGPFGTFSFRDNNSKNIIFIATGTGIAPIKAIIENFHKNKIKKNIYVLWGARNHKDFYLNIGSLFNNCKFIPVLSRENIDGYFHGYVQDAILNLGIDLAESSVYACGSITMINDAFKILNANGLDKKSFYSDAFVSSN